MVLPLLGELVQEMDVMPYITAPIVSDSTWDAFVDGLRVIDGDAHVDAFSAASSGRAKSHPVDHLKSRL